MSHGRRLTFPLFAINFQFSIIEGTTMLSPVIDLSKREITGFDPRDGSLLEPVVATTLEELPRLIEAAKAAQPLWASISAQDRAVMLRRARARFVERAASLVALLCRENGKPEGEAYTSEIIPNIGLFDYWLAEAPKLLQPKPVKLSPLEYPKKRGSISLEPRGVVGLIAPWNYPISLPLRSLIPALLAGNAVVFKPSEYAPRVGKEMAALFEGILPEGTLTLVQGGGELGAAMIDHVDYVIFTGSVATGRKVAERAARRLIPVALELGGKDAALVLEDADIERAAQGICWASFSNAGQNCAAVERVYVVESVAQTFINRVTEITQELRLSQDIGPLVHAVQRSLVEGQLAQARDAGAQVKYGGQRGPGPGFYLQPTIVLLPQNDQLALERDETFGPVMPIRVVKDEAEAVARSNDSRYGLTASVWTRDIARGEKVAAKLKVGVVTINNHSFTAALPMAPWSGVNESGSGVTNSARAFEEMCRPKFTLIDASTDARELWWYPYNDTLTEIGKALVQRAKGGVSTVLGMGKALTLLPRRFRRSS
jgi:acyl-CoA reductase-like NAD-dependent aldehyde dehydrogenase